MGFQTKCEKIVLVKDFNVFIISNLIEIVCVALWHSKYIKYLKVSDIINRQKTFKPKQCFWTTLKNKSDNY